MFTPLPTSKSRLSTGRGSSPATSVDRGLTPASADHPHSARGNESLNGQKPKSKQRRRSTGRAVRSRFMQDAEEKARRGRQSLGGDSSRRNPARVERPPIKSRGKASKSNVAAKKTGIARRVSVGRGGAATLQKGVRATPKVVAHSKFSRVSSMPRAKPTNPTARARGQTLAASSSARLGKDGQSSKSDANASNRQASVDSCRTPSESADSSNIPQVVAGGPSDTIRDLHERLMLAQTKILQWLYATARLDNTAKLQAGSMQRQVYAVWRATQQALNTTSHFERVLSAAKFSFERRKALLREYKALQALGAIEQQDKCGTPNADILNQQQNELILRGQSEFKTFVKALSNSLEHMPVFGMTATTSSQSILLENSLRDLKSISSAIKSAISSEASTIRQLAQSWSKLAKNALDASKLLAGPCLDSLETIDRLTAEKASLDADAIAAKHRYGVLDSAVDRAQLAISGIPLTTS